MGTGRSMANWARPARALNRNPSIGITERAYNKKAALLIMSKAAFSATRHCRQHIDGGERGIRTLGTFARTPDFESGTFDHSATSPGANFYKKTLAGRR